MAAELAMRCINIVSQRLAPQHDRRVEDHVPRKSIPVRSSLETRENCAEDLRKIHGEMAEI
jgi:hypothetical protein